MPSWITGAPGAANPSQVNESWRSYFELLNERTFSRWIPPDNKFVAAAKTDGQSRDGGGPVAAKAAPSEGAGAYNRN